MSDRPKALYYAGDGSEFFAGVPARDLDEADVAALTDDQLRDVTADNPRTGKPLYLTTKPTASDREPAKDAPPPADTIVSREPEAPEQEPVRGDAAPAKGKRG